jgi:hypothetical protein
MASPNLASRQLLEANLRGNSDPVSGTGHGSAVPVFISAMAPVRPVTGRGCGTAESGDMIEE